MNASPERVALLAVAALGVALTAAAAPWWTALVLGSALVMTLLLGLTRRQDGARSTTAKGGKPTTATSVAAPAVVRPSGDGTLRFTDAAAAGRLGWRTRSLGSTGVASYVHREDVDRLAAAIDAIGRAPGTIAELAVRVDLGDGWTGVRIRLTNGSGVHEIEGFTLEPVDTAETGHPARPTPDDTARVVAIAGAARLAAQATDEVAVADHVARVAGDLLGTASCEVYRRSGDRIELIAGVHAGRRAERRTVAHGSDPLVEAGCEASGPLGGGPGATIEPITEGTHAWTSVAVPIGEPRQGALVVRTITPVAFADGDIAFLEALAGLLALGEQRRDAERSAQRSSRQDTLTGLVNRNVFVERLRNTLTRARRQEIDVAVMLIDLDNFKLVNDSLGHAAGDTVLEACSSRLSAALRPGDVLARFGGDEFVVLTTGFTTIDAATVAADRLRAAIQLPIRVLDQDVRVTASVGLAVADGEPTAEELLQYADAALHEAKARGRERVERFSPALLDEVVTRLRTESELRDALEEGQLRVFYQPIVDLHTGSTVAAEALIRWLRPGRGLVTPSEFIPISEATGLIEEIGAWVIREAVAQAAKWAADGRPLPVSVNLAQRQLVDPGLLRVIDEALESCGLGPESLGVELTEGMVMADRAAALETLQQLADRGIRIAIDDFGTGYSSMAYLQTLPVDVVKIDRSFVSGVDRSKSDYAITSAMIQVCRALGKTVVAEGVETDQQLELLRDLHCDLAQGFLFSPAVIDLQVPSVQESWSQLILDRG